MKPVNDLDIRKLADSPEYDKAVEYLQNGWVWKYRNRLAEAPVPEMPEKPEPSSGIPQGSAGAYVLDKKGGPFFVLWNREEWYCECGSQKPCVHLAALLIRISENCTDCSELENLFKKHEKEKKQNTPENTAPDTHEKAPLDPETDLLFFTEPAQVKKNAVLVLDTEKEITEKIKSPLPLWNPENRKTEKLIFNNVLGENWILISAVKTLRNDGIEPVPKLPVKNDPVIKPENNVWDNKFSNYQITDANGIQWKKYTGCRIFIYFDPVLTFNSSEPLYKAGVSVQLENSKLRTSSDALFFPDKNILFISKDKNAVIKIRDSGSTFIFLRLLFSKKIFTLSDIKDGILVKRNLPEKIEIIFPDFPETLTELSPKLILRITDITSDYIDLKPFFSYSGIEISPESGEKIIISKKDNTALGLRSRKKESELLELSGKILSEILTWQIGYYSGLKGIEPPPVRIEINLTDFITLYSEKLLKNGIEIYIKNKPVKKTGNIRINTKKKDSILEMNVVIEEHSTGRRIDPEIDEWLEKEKLIAGENNYFLLTEKNVEQLNFLKRQGMDNSGFLTAAINNLSLIDTIYDRITAAEENTGEIIKNKKEIFESLKKIASDNYKKEKINLPGNFKTELRAYQITGFKWLSILHKYNIGGCLADDMGLGKTIQTLAFLSALKEKNQLKISLIIGPVVTLSNWENEIKKFAPCISYIKYAGAAKKRHLPENNTKTDIVLVSYQTLRNDIEKFIEKQWDIIILDEAHYVKNASSGTFKAVRSLKSNHRFSLTGTPLENHPGELWSQMDFLNPGLLGSRKNFYELYIKSKHTTENSGEFSGYPSGKTDHNNNILSKIISPFILRRKKSDVLVDLPPKEETVIYCGMSEQQKEIYNATRNAYLKQISGIIDKKGLEKSRIEILSIISRLRMLAIYPPMAGELFKDIPSGKITLLENLLEELIEENHKILVFSQYLGVLGKTESICRNNRWKYSMITGTTKNRQEQINSFQNNKENRIFLLSLKAGGVGINLTAADYVIILDPWWNPAVESQAVDRAHRMGQKNPVIAYKIITRGSIEEKVLELQNEKKEMIYSILEKNRTENFDINTLNENEILNLFK